MDNLVLLWREILQRPKEDLPREALADALDERGNPRDARWAEFIRSQVKRFRRQGRLPRCTTPDATPPCSVSHCLACREHHLLVQDATDKFLLSESVRALTDRLLSYEFGRGFLETVTAANTLTSIDAALELFSRHPIETINIAVTGPEDNIITASIEWRSPTEWVRTFDCDDDGPISTEKFSSRERLLKDLESLRGWAL